MEYLFPLMDWLNQRSGRQTIWLAIGGFFLFPFLILALPLPTNLGRALGGIVSWGWLLGVAYLWFERPKPQTAGIPTPGKGSESGPAKPLGFVLQTSAQGYPVLINNPFRGVLIIGGAGAGKSVSLIEPLIYQAVEKQYAGLLYDYKFPELARHLDQAYRLGGRAGRPGMITFSDVTRSNRVNPLAFMPSISYAQEYASAVLANLLPESISKPDFWTRSAESVLAATFWFLHEHHPQQATLPHAVALALSPIAELVGALSTNTQCAGLVASVRQAIESQASAQLSGVTATLQMPLAKINVPEIAWVLSGDDFSLNLNDPENPQWLCIGNTPALSETYSPVLSLIATSCIKQMNQDEKAPSMVLLDEAPTLYIPKLDNLPATGRGYKVATVYAAQDLAQMVDRYGQTKADTLLANFGNQFYGRVSHPKTAEYVSKLFGQMDQHYHMTSVNQDTSLFRSATSTSASVNIQQRDRLKVQDMGLLSPGHFYGMVVESTLPEFQAQFTPPTLPRPAELAPVQVELRPEDVHAHFMGIHQWSRSVLDDYRNARTLGPPTASDLEPDLGVDPDIIV